MRASDSGNLIALPAGFRLGEYRIERYLGSGGFGITYAAIEENLNRRLAIKEYLPKAFAMRGADDQVTVATAEDEADFRWGLDRFLDEARALARFDHPNIVSVERFVEAHGTAYIVMEHVEGESLSELLKRKRTLTEGEIREHVLPVANGLAEVHRAGLLHRDIKPGNIVVRATSGVPVLIDFGSARHEASAKSQSLTAVITPGYAPLEQYSSSLGDERPATDIYAFGAVLYRCVTGDSPPDATDRALEDRLKSAVEAADGIYSPGLLAAIDAALRMRADERPRDVAAFLQRVSTVDIRGERPEDAGGRQRLLTKTVALPAWAAAGGDPPLGGKQRLLTKTMTRDGRIQWEFLDVPSDRSWDGETAHAPGAGPGLGTGRDVAHSNEVGSSANREKAGRSLRWKFWALAMTIAVIFGVFALDIFVSYLRGGDLEPSSDWHEPVIDPPPAKSPIGKCLERFRDHTDLPVETAVDICRVDPDALASPLRPAPGVTSETPSVGELPRSVLPVTEREPVDSAPSSSFTIEVEPPHARVRVMNIVPVYEPGIMLAAGSYTVEVSAPGYETVTEAVRHDATTPTAHRVELQLSMRGLAINATTTGRLASGDLEIDDGRFADLWRVQVPAGQTLTIEMSSSHFDAVLALYSAQDPEFVRADRAGDHVDAELDVVTEFSGMDTARVSVDVPQQGGEYFVVATSDAAGEEGAYELRVDVPSPAPLAGGKVDSVVPSLRQIAAQALEIARNPGGDVERQPQRPVGTNPYLPPSGLMEHLEDYLTGLVTGVHGTASMVLSPTFTRGSHEDDVLRVQGTPTAINIHLASETWWYGSSSVKISKHSRRVTEWSNRDRNLKVR